MSNVDVAICAYGKPYQTAVTISSLLQHSGQHLGRIFIQEERHQPFGDQVDYLVDAFPDAKITIYVPPMHADTFWLDERALRAENVRKSVRYEIAWEACTTDYLFICHNDVLFSGDTVGAMLGEMGDTFTGAGVVGQCWNCPANYAKLCNGDRHEDFHPTYEQMLDLIQTHPGPRMRPEDVDRTHPMPTTECRLGEFACLIDMRKAKPVTAPVGPIVPFGWFSHDTGVLWFRQMRLLGHRFKNMAPHFTHAPFIGNSNGHEALSNRSLYQKGENAARFWLSANDPDTYSRIEELRAACGLVAPFNEGYLSTPSRRI